MLYFTQKKKEKKIIMIIESLALFIWETGLQIASDEVNYLV